jgi:predicted component of type VI protein secretion system
VAEDAAIRFNISSDPQLNLYNEKPHSLLCCVYQLSNTNKFNQLAGDRNGMYTLRRCDLFDGTVTGAKRYFIQPGVDLQGSLDRLAGTKYVAVVAGYKSTEKDRVTHIYDIPVVEETKGLIRRTKIKKLAPLDITLRLGPHQIEGF